jgi:hypothetical protein
VIYRTLHFWNNEVLRLQCFGSFFCPMGCTFLVLHTHPQVSAPGSTLNGNLSKNDIGLPTARENFISRFSRNPFKCVVDRLPLHYLHRHAGGSQSDNYNWLVLF